MFVWSPQGRNHGGGSGPGEPTPRTMSAEFGGAGTAEGLDVLARCDESRMPQASCCWRVNELAVCAVGFRTVRNCTLLQSFITVDCDSRGGLRQSAFPCEGARYEQTNPPWIQAGETG